MTFCFPKSHKKTLHVPFFKNLINPQLCTIGFLSLLKLYQNLFIFAENSRGVRPGASYSNPRV